MANDDDENKKKVVDLNEAKRQQAAARAAAEREAAAEQPPRELAQVDDAEFRALGHNRGRFYFLSRHSGQIIEQSGRSLRDEGSLLTMAPLSYWEREFQSKAGFDKSAAANAMIQACYREGVFDVQRMRGRGAWWDDGRVVLHVGDRLNVDGADVKVSEFQTRFIYEAAPSFNIAPGEPLTNREAHRFVDLCQSLRWERPYMATLLAGWCVVAPLCGALAFRPHIWITGESASGKTWVYENIVKPALTGIALAVQSKTSEPGIRRALSSDARPVLFDEAESENIRDRERIQRILDFCRQATSDDAPPIIQAKQGGEGVNEYRGRAAFCLISINESLSQQADENRFSVLSLLGASDGDLATRMEHFDGVKRLASDVMVPTFSARLLARSLALLPVIRKNAEVFAQAASEILGNRLLGDHLGSMLAGAAALHHGKLIELDEARERMRRDGWAAEIAVTTAAETDHDRLLSFICQQVTTLRLGNASSYERTFGDLIAIMARDEMDQTVPRDAADIHLKRHGVRVLRDPGTGVGASPASYTAWFANKHSALERLLRDTPWATKWGNALARIPGAVKRKDPMKFGHGSLSRAVGIPTELISGSERQENG